MSELDELRARVVALEERAGLNEQVRTGIEGDLTEVTLKVRAMHHLVQALQITQGEHTAMLEGMSTKLNRIEAGLTLVTSLIQTLIDRAGNGEQHD